MNKENCFLVGHISKLHGYNGKLVIITSTFLSSDFTKKESVFIEINAQLIPFFIEEFNPSGKTSIIVSFQDIDSDLKAKALVKCNVYLPLSDMPIQKDKKGELSELIGFSVIDDAHGEIGIISSILEMPQQQLLEIKKGIKEILIPANENIIYKIDVTKKIVYINAPDGLIEIYL